MLFQFRFQLETISNTISERVIKNITTFCTCTSITPVLQDFADCFLNIISFQHVLHFDVGRSLIEWNMKVKIEIQFVQV